MELEWELCWWGCGVEEEGCNGAVMALQWRGGSLAFQQRGGEERAARDAIDGDVTLLKIAKQCSDAAEAGVKHRCRLHAREAG